MSTDVSTVRPLIEDTGAGEGGNAPADNYRRSLRHLVSKFDDGEIAEVDFVAIGEFVLSHDPDQYEFPGEERSHNTLRAYCRKLIHLAERSPKPLVDMTANDVNKLMRAYRQGEADGIKDEGLSTNSVRQYQNFLRKFYEHHEDLPIEKDEISLESPERQTVDDNDVLSNMEVEDLRDAINNSRDRALFEFLYDTGMRFRVAQALKLKHIDLENGQFTMPDAEGLKGARKIMLTRSLFGSVGAIRRWIQDHPSDPNANPEHFLFTARPGTGLDDPENEMSYNSIRRALQRIAERAGYDPGQDGDIKINPHNFRHTWVTRAVLDWELDNDEIKKHLGHRPDSNVMQVTYSHLKDEEWIDRMEKKVGIATPEEGEKDLPKFKNCQNCSSRLDYNAKACPDCGLQLTPDAVGAGKEIQQDIGAEKAMASEQWTQEEIEDMAQDDELLARLIEARSARS